jgi:hypothetical protein
MHHSLVFFGTALSQNTIVSAFVTIFKATVQKKGPKMILPTQ